MNKLKLTANCLLALAVFLAIGEAIVRIDLLCTPFGKKNKVTVAATVATTEELELVQSDELTVRDEDLRIMVLGDSYINGAGVAFENKTSQKLKNRLRSFVERDERFGNAFVLDLSRPGNNTKDNYHAFFEFFDRFRPQVAVLGYSMNDVNGGLNDAAKVADNEGAPGLREKPTLTQSKKEKTSLRHWVDTAYKNSKLVFFISMNLQMHLRTKGVHIPFGDFDYLTNRAYTESNKDWITSQRLILDMQQHCQRNDCQLVIYQFPDFSLLHRPQYFEKMDHEIGSFFDQHPEIVFVNGKDDFDAANRQDYMMSKYDGHPSPNAHSRIAKTIFGRIRDSIDTRSSENIH